MELATRDREVRLAPRAAVVEVGPVDYGPCLGEFAHELMGAAILRGMAGELHDLRVITRPGRGPLYKGIDCELVYHDIRCQGNGHEPARGETIDPNQLVQWYRPGARRLPQFNTMSHVQIAERANYVRYGTFRDEFAGCVAVHARSRAYVESRNWPIGNWHRLARWMCRELGLSHLVCLGTRDAAFCVEGAADLRGEHLNVQMDVLASARFIVGPSSGPMHLAEHCGCPVVVWCGGPECRMIAARYRVAWNPFGALAHAYADRCWRPSVAAVKSWVARMFEETAHGGEDRNTG